MVDDPPPPSYEAARAAGAAPPGQQLPASIPATQYYSTNPTPNSHSNASYTPNMHAASPSGAGGEAIAMQPLSQPPMNPTGEEAAAAAQLSSIGNSNKNTKVVPLHLMSEKPEWVDCPFCKKRTKTRIVKKGGKLQWYVLPWRTAWLQEGKDWLTCEVVQPHGNGVLHGLRLPDPVALLPSLVRAEAMVLLVVRQADCSAVTRRRHQDPLDARTAGGSLAVCSGDCAASAAGSAGRPSDLDDHGTSSRGHWEPAAAG